MKKSTWLFLLTLIIMSALGVHFQFRKNSLVSNQIEKYLKLKTYEIKEAKRKGPELYIKIQPNDKLVNEISNFKETFVDSSRITSGRFKNEFINYKEGNRYYIDSINQDMYGFVMIEFSPSQNEIRFYRNFGD